MESEIKEIIANNLDELHLFVDSVIYEKENGNMFLRICLDSEDEIDLKKVVEATNIINPLLDAADIIKEEYIVEIYGKSKGSKEE